jgi:hypothetical protein
VRGSDERKRRDSGSRSVSNSGGQLSQPFLVDESERLTHIRIRKLHLCESEEKARD